jgi:hypothetical protein
MQAIVYETSFSVGSRGKTKLAPMFFLTIEFKSENQNLHDCM